MALMINLHQPGWAEPCSSFVIALWGSRLRFLGSREQWFMRSVSTSVLVPSLLLQWATERTGVWAPGGRISRDQLWRVGGGLFMDVNGITLEGDRLTAKLREGGREHPA